MQQVTQGGRLHIGIVQISIMLTTLITAGAHIWLSTHPDEDMRFWFLLNGLGYLVLLVAFFLPQLEQFHNSIRWAFIGYTLLTIILWFFLGSPSEGWPWDPFDVSIKIVEVVLVACLFLETRYQTMRRL